MSNPARLLHEILREWSVVPAGQNAEAFRQDHNGWPRHRLAMVHLAEIVRFLDGMEAVGQAADEYRAYVPAWTEAILSVRTEWRISVTDRNRQSIDDPEMAMLQALGTLMDATAYVQSLPVENITKALAAIEGARDLIRESNTIGVEAKRYLLALAAEAITTLSEIGTFGEARARAITFELGGAMITTSGLVPKEEAQTWRERAVAIMQELVLFAGKAMIGGAALHLGLPPGS